MMLAGAVGSMRTKDIPVEMVAKNPNDPKFKIPEPQFMGSAEFDEESFKRSRLTFAEIGKDVSRLHLIVDMSRIGANLFSTKMEYTYFAPRSGKNKQFDMSIIKWPNADFGIMWAILSFPIEYRPQAEAIAKETGLRFSDGVPTVIDGDGAHSFPLDGKTVFCLENIHNHQVYQNDPESFQKLRDEEFAAVDAIHNADRKVLINEFLKQGYTEGQAERIVQQWEAGNEEYNETPLNVSDGSHRHGSPK